MPFIDAKVYYDGSHYVAIPKTSRPPRAKTKKKDIVVEIKKHDEDKEEKYIEEIEDTKWMEDLIEVDDDFIPFEDVQEEDVVMPKKKVVNLSKIFEDLYTKSLDLSKYKRKSFIIKEIKKYFDDEELAKSFVEENYLRKLNNITARRTRLMRKINLQEFNYFCTFTYDETKMDDKTFKKKLAKTFANFASRKDWKYIGVWELSPEKKRLHFHGLFSIPEGSIPGNMEMINSYSFAQHKRQNKQQNSYFRDRFGINDFSEIDTDIDLKSSMVYLTKYLEKTGEKIVYSKGLPTYFQSDILDDDVLCNCGVGDKKLVLYDRFQCIDEGEIIGPVSKETIAKMRHTN